MTVVDAVAPDVSEEMTFREFCVEFAERYPTPQERGKAFEKIMKLALSSHPNVYGKDRFSDVWLWKDWPERENHNYTAQDIGIDLVARQTKRYGGGFCAIQTKFHQPGSTVAKSGVDSFLAASSAEPFAARLLVNTASLGSHAATMVEQASPTCHILNYDDLGSLGVNWADCLLDPSKAKAEPVARHTPKPFQTEAVDAVVEGLTTLGHDKGRLILPCGTGKSVVSLWIAEKLIGVGGRVLYLVPSIALMNQTMREWAAQRDPEIDARYIGVCSDTKAGLQDEDTALCELAMPVTTDPGKIAAELRKRDANAMTVVFCTYQSLSLISDAQAGRDGKPGAPKFDLVLADEAHRTTGIEDTSAATPPRANLVPRTRPRRLRNGPTHRSTSFMTRRASGRASVCS